MNKIKQYFDYYNFELFEEEACYIKNIYNSSFENEGIPCGSHAVGIYCKEPLSYSKFHRLSHDEMWHFYDGNSFKLYLLFPNGTCKTVVMGKNIENGEHINYLIPANTWQAAELVEGEYSLFGCTVVPGFANGVFELRDRNILEKEYPDYKEIIERL